MIYSCLSARKCHVNWNLTMFLLVSLLFVTAAVLVDKPEPVLDLHENYDEHFDNTEEGADKIMTVSEGDPALTMALDQPKFIFDGYKAQFIATHLERGEEEDVSFSYIDITDRTAGDKFKQLSEQESDGQGQDISGQGISMIDSSGLYGHGDTGGERFRVKRHTGEKNTLLGDDILQDIEHFNSDEISNGNVEGEYTASKHTTESMMAEDALDMIETNVTESSEDTFIGIQSKKHNKFRKRVFNPWVFETEIGNHPETCFERLTLSKTEIEDFTQTTSSNSRLNTMKMIVMDTNYTQSRNGPHHVYKRSMGTAPLHGNSPSLGDVAMEEGHAPPMIAPDMVRDCQFLLPYKRQWIKLVSSCPSTWQNATVEYMCEPHYRDIADDNTIDLLSMPVQDSRGIVYRNIFCAECNQVANAQAWDVVILCDGTSSLFFIDGNVMMTIMPKLAAAKHCRKTLWPPLPEKIETCLITKRRARHDVSPRSNSHQDELVTYPVSFSVLMNFGFDGKTHILFSTTHKVSESEKGQMCSQPDQMYDSKNKQCRTIVCPAGYRLVEEECLMDDMSGPVQSTDDLLPNVQTLTHLQDVAVITLTVNATYRNLRALKSRDFITFMVEGMATLFNISSERIQNFTIERVNSSDPGPEVAVQTLHKQPVIQPGENLLGSLANGGDFPSEEDELKASVAPNQIHSQIEHPSSSTFSSYVQEDPSETETYTSTHKHSQVTLPHKQRITENARTRKLENKKEREEVNKFPHIQTVTMPQHKKRHPTPTTAPSDPLDLLSEKTITLQFRFLLLPARTSMLNEGTVSSISEKMKALFQQKKFTLSLNGTEVTVVDMVNNNHQELMGTFCSKGQMQFYFADQLDIINAKDSLGNTITHVMVTATNSIYGPGKFDLTLWMTGNVGSDTNVTDVMGYAFVCAMPRISHAKCARLTLPIHEYVMFSNKSILWAKKVYNMTEYEYLDETQGTVEICVPEWILHPVREESSFTVHGCDEGFENFMLAEGYMTAVLGRISIVALAIVFLTYLLFPRLRNLPGVNTMNLTLSLLIAESIFITGENSDAWLCSLVAILLHYFFLASFFWMNVMSYDVFRTFANTTYVLPQIREKSKYLCKYIIYAWGAPAVIVCVCVILDFTEIIPGVKIGYGSNAYKTEASENLKREQNYTDDSTNTTEEKARKVLASNGCWIQRPIPSLTAFGAPMLIIVLVNSCMFIKTILCIQRTAKFTMDNTRRSSVNKRTGRHDVMLYVRMSAVMGFTWVFGLASSLISALPGLPSDVFCYTEYVMGILFIIFNCSQGLFVFFVFVTKRRVFYLYRGLWVKLRKKIAFRHESNRQRHTSGSNTSTSSSTTSISTIT